ncbi:MAG: alpha/beta hydrolase [Nanoarchaeota archaeon]|nr:alpha/beta hydrolase [Nanoarchaeota archaeon]
MKEQKISVYNQHNEKLVGLKTIPEKGNRIVLLVHGFGVTKEESGMFDDIAQNLANQGITVYRFDFSGCGQSQGDYSEITLTKLGQDLRTIIEKIDSQNLCIISQSFGTSVTIIVAPKAKCFIMMGSISNPKKILADLFGENYNPEGISWRKRSSGKITKIKPGFWKDLQKHDLTQKISKIKTPILYIHGSEDDKVPLTEMLEFYKNTENAEKRVLEGAGHDLKPCREEMKELILAWCKKHLA